MLTEQQQAQLDWEKLTDYCQSLYNMPYQAKS
jgi:hypothetical protein